MWIPDVNQVTGRVECAYEPVMTKAFLHGRTEAIRSVQPESVEFTKVKFKSHCVWRVDHIICTRSFIRNPLPKRKSMRSEGLVNAMSSLRRSALRAMDMPDTFMHSTASSNAKQKVT